MAKAKDEFIPQDYKLPDTSGYMKFIPGDNKFRILSSPVIGYEYWTTDNKPVRSKEQFVETPNAKKEKNGSVNVNYFWAMVVYNYQVGAVQTLEITQKGILKYILGLVNNESWGSPKGYDLVVNRSGSGLETKYTTVANPHSEVDPQVIEQFEKADINLQDLFENKEA